LLLHAKEAINHFCRADLAALWYPRRLSFATAHAAARADANAGTTQAQSGEGAMRGVRKNDPLIHGKHQQASRNIEAKAQELIATKTKPTKGTPGPTSLPG
jgi:hypothetical protein